MNPRKQFNPNADDRAEFPKLKAQYNEDPARFLQSSKALAFARIRGIRNTELLEAYRAVARQILSGEDKDDVLEALDTRERELTGDEITPEANAEPVAATDGGENIQTETATRDEIMAHDGDEPHPVFEVPHKPIRVPVKRDDPAPEPEGADDDEPAVHPNAKGLEAGEVLVVEFPSAKEYIFPATPDADAPFLLVGVDDAGEYTDTLTLGEAAGKLSGSADPKPIAEIDIEPPANAATTGGEN